MTPNRDIDKLSSGLSVSLQTRGLTEHVLGKSQFSRHVLGAEHLVPILPVGEGELVGQREPGLRAGRVAAETLGLADRQLGVAGDRAGARQVEVLNSLLAEKIVVMEL